MEEILFSKVTIILEDKIKSNILNKEYYESSYFFKVIQM